MSLLFVFVPLIAFIYASVGFGGATGYLAVMSLFGIEPQVMASTALALNILVAGISFLSYYRAGHLNSRLLWPFLITSVPAAFWGGSYKFTDQTYYILLYGVLTFVAIRLLFFSKKKDDIKAVHAVPFFPLSHHRFWNRAALRHSRHWRRNFPLAHYPLCPMGKFQTSGHSQRSIYRFELYQWVAWTSRWRHAYP